MVRVTCRVNVIARWCLKLVQQCNFGLSFERTIDRVQVTLGVLTRARLSGEVFRS